MAHQEAWVDGDRSALPSEDDPSYMGGLFLVQMTRG